MSNLAEDNMGLTFFIAAKYGKKNMQENAQIAYVALVEAAKKFKPEYGFKFSTYACTVMSNSIRRTYKKKLDKQEKFAKYCKLRHEYTPFKPFEDVQKQETGEYVRSKLRHLSAKELDVVKRRHGIETEKETADQIGDSYGVTRQRIDQIYNKALKKLRQKFDDEDISMLNV